MKDVSSKMRVRCVDVNVRTIVSISNLFALCTVLFLAHRGGEWAGKEGVRGGNGARLSAPTE